MSDKRYPTRMHEVLGVKPMQLNTCDNGLEVFHFYVNWKGELFDERNIPLGVRRMLLLVNHPERITRRPRLTEEQEAQLKALDTLGFKWLAKDENDEVAAFKRRPDKGRGQWQDGGEYIVLYPFMPMNCLMDLPDWSDHAPLDIVQVLRQNGVEVEG